MVQAIPLKRQSFNDYLFKTIFHPRQTFELLLQDERRLKFGFFAMVISAVVYTFVYIFLTMGGGAPSSFDPWLAVAKDVYYSYNRFWLAPSMLGGWILAAGVAYLLSRLVSGRGSFDDTISVFGFGITIATLVSALHDLTDSFLSAIGLLDQHWYEIALNSPTIWRTILLTLYSISLILLFVYLIIGVSRSQKIQFRHALWIGCIAAATYQGVFFIFNR
jgi:Yip1 domain